MLTHFDFLNKLDKNDYDFYKKAYDGGATIRKRFKLLPAVDKNFTLVKLEDNRKVYQTSMQPAGFIQTLFNKQKTNNFEELINMKNLIESLKDFIEFKALLVNSENNLSLLNRNTFESSNFESIDWSQLNTEQTNNLISMMSESNEIEKICFKNCSTLEEKDLIKIFKSNYSSLKAISIQNCEKINKFDLFDDSRIEPTLIERVLNGVKTNFSKNFEILFLSRLNLEIIKTTSLFNISCLYLWNLDNLKSIELENYFYESNFRLKEVFIEFRRFIKIFKMEGFQEIP